MEHVRTDRPDGERTSGRESAPHRWSRRWVAWAPGADTAWAMVTLLAMWAGYYGTSVTGSAVPLFAAALVFGTAIPAWCVLQHRREGWAGLGVTRRRLVVSLVLALILGGGSAMQVFRLAAAAHADPVAHLVANLFVFWEPFFFFGWFCLRAERAFGAIAAPLLTGVAFTVMHLGSVPLAQAVAFGVFGLVFAVLMTATRNLAVLWPLAYPVTSAIGTLQAGIAFDWNAATLNAVFMLVQFGCLYGIAVNARRRGSGAA